MRQGRYALAAAAAAVIVLAAPTAMAQTARDRIVQTIIDNAKAAGAKDVAYGRVVGDDQRFTIEDFKATVEVEQDGAKKDATATMARMTVVGGKPTPDGGYTAAEVGGEDFSMTTDDTTISIGSFRATDVAEPGAAKVTPGTSLVPGRRFGRVEAKTIEITPEDGSKVDIESIAMDARDWAEAFPRGGSFKISGIAIPLDDAESMAQIKALGYDSITIDFDSAARWDEKTGQLALSNFAITARDMGVLKLSGTFGGLTQDVVSRLQALKPEENDKALELLQGISIADLRITFENRSIVEKGLDFAAQQQGVKRQDLITQANQTLPTLLAVLNNKAFEQKVTRAVSTFLAQPKSLTVIAKPAQPLPISQIVGTVLTAPQTIPTLVGADVLANQ